VFDHGTKEYLYQIRNYAFAFCPLPTGSQHGTLALVGMYLVFAAFETGCSVDILLAAANGSDE